MLEAYEYLLKDVGITYGDAVVVGVSGGPDSMALLSLLIKLKKAFDLKVICAHINHNVRSESYEEKEMVEKYARNNGIIFESMIIEDYGDDNFHNEARSIRYNYFNGLVIKYSAKYLFTAHHADDLMETILMRIVRGSTLRGYSGFSRVLNMNGYKLIRPLIHIKKDDIIKYLKEKKIPYMVDSSNDKDVYTRNRFRKYVIPFLKKEDTNVHEKFYKFSKVLLEYNDFVLREMKKVLKKVCPSGILNIPSFLELDKVLQMKIIYHMFEEFYQDDLMLINDHHAELIYKLLCSKKANARIYLPNYVKGEKTYDTFLFIRDIPTSFKYEIQIDDYLNLPNGKNIERINETDLNDNSVCRLNSNDVKLPLSVRNRENGDKMYIKGMLGSKKINDIFIDMKITIHDRDLWPIVVDSGGDIVWLPGLKKSKFDKQKNEKYDIILKYY